MAKKSVGRKPTKPTNDEETSAKRSGRRLVPLIPHDQDTSDDSKSGTRKVVKIDEGTPRRRSKRIPHNPPIYKAQYSSDDSKSATRKPVVKTDEGTSGKRKAQYTSDYSKSATRKPVMKIDEGTSGKRPIYEIQDTSDDSNSAPRKHMMKTDEGISVKMKSGRISIYKTPDTSDDSKTAPRKHLMKTDEGSSGKMKGGRIPIYMTQDTSDDSVSATRKPVEGIGKVEDRSDENLDTKGLALPTFNVVRKRRTGLGPAPKSAVLDPQSSVAKHSDLAQYKLQCDEVNTLAKELKNIDKKQQATRALYDEAALKMRVLRDCLMAKETINAESPDERKGAALIVRAGFDGSVKISSLAKKK